MLRHCISNQSVFYPCDQHFPCRLPDPARGLQKCPRSPLGLQVISTRSYMKGAFISTD